MSKRRLLQNDDVFYRPDIVPTYNYSKLFMLIRKYKISQKDFTNLAGISPETLQRLRQLNPSISTTTEVKIICALNKLNPYKKHYRSDFVTVCYE